jgi:hypothetical protein
MATDDDTKLDDKDAVKPEEKNTPSPLVNQGAPVVQPNSVGSPLAPKKPALAPETPMSPMDAFTKKQEEYERKITANEAQEQQNLADAAAERAKSQKQTADEMGEIQLKKGLLKAPELQQIPYKATKPTSMVEQWGSSAMMFAMLGSLFTRRSAVTALNAAAGAMTGFKERDDAAAKQNLEEWKIANANMLKSAEFQRKAYEDAFKGYDTEEKLAQIKGTAKEKEIDAKVKAVNLALQHTNAETIRMQSGLLGQLRLLDTEKKTADTLALQTQRFVEQQRVNDARVAATEARTKKLEAEVKQKEDAKALLASDAYAKADPATRATMMDKITGDTKHSDMLAKAEAQMKRGGKIQPEEVDAVAQAMADFNYPIPSSTKMSSDPNLRAALVKASQLHPNLAADAIARQKDLIDIESGQTSKTIRSLDVADNHINSFLKALANKPSTGDVGALNNWAASLSKAVNSPEQAKFDTVAEVVANEVVKAVQGTGTAGALADRLALKKIFSNALSSEAGEAVAEQLTDLLNGQRLGIAQEKGRFFTPEQIFGNKKGGALRAYAEANEGLDTFPSNAYQQPGKTLEEVRKVVDPDRPKPPAAYPDATWSPQQRKYYIKDPARENGWMEVPSEEVK